MSDRQDPLALFFSIASGIVGKNWCHFNVQPDLFQTSTQRPSIVYTEVGNDTIQTFSGPQEVSISVRCDVRARSWPDVFRVSDEVISKLRKSGRLVNVVVSLAEFEEDIDIFRRIRTLVIRR